jgi:HTH-type transcriptional regulator / antitoxin HigA
MSTAVGTPRRVSDKYLKLIRSFPLRPLRTDDENDEAIEVIASLGSREPLDPAERDYLDVLVDLVRKYEADHYPIPRASGPAVVRHLIEARGVTQAEVSSATGIAESSLSDMLAGKRKMATSHVKALARFFGVTADTVIGS